MESEFAFQQDYDVQVDPELPSGRSSDNEQVLYFPGGSERGGRNGILLRLAPRTSPPWFGMFAWGGGSSYSAVLGSPEANHLLVVATGQGYDVDVTGRTAREVDVFPIYGSFVAADDGVTLFYDGTSIVAYGSRGVRWKVPRLAFDGIEILGIRDGKVYGLADDPSGQVEFEIDLDTGHRQGGSPPDE